MLALSHSHVYNPAILLKQVSDIMPGVFISYRRDDSAAYAGRLFDILSAAFGADNTFMDVDDIKGGDDFTTVIERKLGVSDALTAVIGPRWLSDADASGARRLDNPNDFVRIEIAKALQRGIRVIPVLVGGATLPHPSDLPDNLKALCERQAVEIRDTRFHEDAKDLVDVLHRTLHGTGLAPTQAKLKRFLPVLLIFAVVIAGAVSWLLLNHRKAPGHPQANVAGEWQATVKYDWGDTYHELFDFQVNGQELSGTAGFLGTPKGQGRPIWDGKIVGDQVSFMTKSLTSISGDEKTYEDKHYYKGVAKGDAIDFTLVTDSSVEQHPEIHFTANRVKP
ncbi:MAG: toll/interleukin-1 receptor domain-containing protein [Candidatus Korobacteraceae bacterium]